MTIEIQILEDKILEIFRSVTQVPSLTANDDFFNSGGDSLLAVEAGFQISQAIDEEIDPMMIFVFSTASTCAVAVLEQCNPPKNNRDDK